MDWVMLIGARDDDAMRPAPEKDEVELISLEDRGSDTI
jgi:hypothetical protein